MVSKSRFNIRLDDAVRQYLDRIKNEGQSEFSQRTALYALGRFERALATKREPHPWVHLIDEKDCDNYCFGPGGIRKDVKSITFNRYRSVLKVFFDYAVMMRWTDTNPMVSVPPARPDAPTKRLMLSASEMLAMLEQASNPAERCALSIGMNTGLRANDIRHLTIFDASLASGTIQTEIRKTRKFDVKPITMELHGELIRWLDTYAKYMGLNGRDELSNEWLLIPSYRLCPQWNKGDVRLRIRPTEPHTHPERMVQRPLRRLGYPTKGEGFHTLRRSSARALFESMRERGEGRDHALMVVKEFLNHASVTQTEKYLGLNHERTIRDTLLKDQPFLTRLAEDEQARAADTTSLPRLEDRRLGT